MKRKLLAALLCCTLAAGLSACGTKTTSTSSSDTMSIPASATSEVVKDADIDIPPVNLIPQETDTYQYLGMALSLPKELREAVLSNTIFMTATEDADVADIRKDSKDIDWQKANADSTLHTAVFDWRYVPKSIRDKTPSLDSTEQLLGDDYQKWFDQTQPMARLAIYNKSEFTDSMLEDSAFTNHEKIGENEKYVFVLHTNDTPEDAKKEAASLYGALSSLKDGVALSTPQPLDKNFLGYTIPPAATVANVGDFKAKTLDGEAIDSSAFAKKKLTVVNVWATWCSACIKELPALENLSNEFKDSNMQIMSVVADTATKKDGVDKEQLELAKQIQKKSGITFPSIVPDDTLLDGILSNITAFPITYFVDSEGNIVGDPVSGSHSEDEWREIMKERLAEVSQ